MILITATGGRPECTALLAEYVARQTYAGPRYWLVIDDCDPPTPVPGPTGSFVRRGAGSPDRTPTAKIYACCWRKPGKRPETDC